MTKSEILNRLAAVATALDNVSVSGRNNLAAIYGCIDSIEKIGAALSATEFIESEEPHEDQ